MKIVGCIVIKNDEGEILCVSRKDNHTDFGLPGGKMEDIDQSLPQITACRETLEETGLSINVEDLELVYACHHDGYMTYTYYTEKFTGEINHNEPHVVMWGTFDDLIEGSFGSYNEQVLYSVLDMLKNK